MIRFRADYLKIVNCLFRGNAAGGEARHVKDLQYAVLSVRRAHKTCSRTQKYSVSWHFVCSLLIELLEDKLQTCIKDEQQRVVIVNFRMV